MLFRCLLLCLALLVTGSLHAADWPQWRGPDRNGISKETGLLQEWPSGGPKLRWQRTDIGTGYSTPVVAGGRVYVQSTSDKNEFALCLDEKTGKEIWKTSIGGIGANRGLPYPGTRSSPTVVNDCVYCLASDGELNCLGTDGKRKWSRNLVKDLGGEVGSEKMSWAYSESVLVDGDLVVCTPGGKEAALAALDRKSGKVVWKSPLAEAEGAEYSSIMVVEAGGSRQYVTFLRKGLIGVDAKTGKPLWRYTRTADMGANIMTPVVSQDRLFASTSRGGGALLQVQDGEMEPKEIYFEKKLASSIGSAVLVDGHLYGATANGMYCAEFATGKEKWVEGPVGNASICFADGRLYVRPFNSGEVILVEPNPKEFVEKGRVKQPERSKIAAWPHPIVANGCLYVRNQDTLVCWEIRK